MQSGQPTPILNTSLPAQFRRIRLALAREPGHPEGDAGVGYVIVAPLDVDDRIDAALWREYREACRVARLRPGEEIATATSFTVRGGGWAFHYDGTAQVPDDVGVYFADDRFVSGEYASINENGKMHTYRVVSVSHL